MSVMVVWDEQVNKKRNGQTGGIKTRRQKAVSYGKTKADRTKAFKAIIISKSLVSFVIFSLIFTFSFICP